MPTFRTPRRGSSYSHAIAEAYASAPEIDIIYDTLEFRHPSFSDGLGGPAAARVVNDLVVLTAGLEATAPLNPGEMVEFQPVRFDFTRPSESDASQSPEIEIQVSNIARILIPYLDQAKESRVPIQVTYRPYLLSDLSAPHLNPPLTLSIRTVTIDTNNVSCTAGFGDLTNRRFPNVDFTALKFPGLSVR